MNVEELKTIYGHQYCDRTSAEYWKNQCFLRDTRDSDGNYYWNWEYALEHESLFETNVGDYIAELVNRYGFEYVANEYDRCKLAMKEAEKEDDNEQQEQ